MAMSSSGSDDDLDLVDGLLEEQFQETSKRQHNLDEDEALSNGECPPCKRSRSDTQATGDSNLVTNSMDNEADGDDDELKEPEHQVRTKIVLKKPHQDYFEMLPEGWIEVTHHSGMPIYLHKASRVCSVSKPYFLGPGSVRKHDIPISAIPCLQYRKQLEEERERQAKLIDQNNTNANGQLANVNVKVQSVEESKKLNSLDYLAVREYCKAVFEFQEIKIRKFKTWADRRTHAAIQKRKERPSLPEGTKLITCPINPFLVDSPNGTGGDSQLNSNRDDANTDSNSNSNGDSSTENACAIATLPKPTVITASSTGVIPKGSKREFIMNPAGKSYVCILHEFIQHTRRVQPSYKFEEVPNAATPYSATVVIDDIHYGTGYGSSKKTAKSEAAKQTLSILIPDYSFDSLCKDKTSTTGATNGSNDCHDTSSTYPISQEQQFFDGIAITDERVPQFCAKTGQYSPFQILVECLKRNHGMGSDKIGFNVDHSRGNQMKNRFTMTAGKHTTTVTGKNKTEGKQKAAQAILALLHPQVTSWGGLLRLYGRGSCKTPKEKKEEEQKITELQSTACANRPNYAILNKLREQMEKLKADKVSVNHFTFILLSNTFSSSQERNVYNSMYISPLVTAIEGLGETSEEPVTSVTSHSNSVVEETRMFNNEQSSSFCPYSQSSNTTATQENISL